MTDTPRRDVAALAAEDTDALLALFADDVASRGMTPGRFWEAATAAEVVHDVLHRWFEPDDVIEQVEAVEPGDLAGRQRVDHRFLVRNAQGLHAVEQRAYLDLDETGRVTRMQAMCAGSAPVA